MTRDRPDQIKPHPVSRLPREEEDDPERRNIANLVALVAVLALVILGYWVFESLDHSRRFLRCLDSGRRNCVDFVGADK
jgi:hypothetical protein